ncbi:MAG TPA: YraN family protein [Patescibacteria group bacterium]|nr:YraN family protein [Patescibacteria group bacterium]
MAFNLKNKLGVWGERLAETEYLKRGYILVARNIHNRRGKLMGEIDLIMRSDKLIIFVEVKARRPSKFGSAVEAVTRAKQQKLIKTIHWFLRRFPQYKNLQPRIDICAIDIHLVMAGDLDNHPKSVIIIPSAVELTN